MCVQGSKKVFVPVAIFVGQVLVSIFLVAFSFILVASLRPDSKI